MTNEIVQKEDKILRKIAKAIPISKIKTPEIKKVIKRMIVALDSQDDGVAIAAPQIGENLRIFVVSKKIFEIMEEEKIKQSLKKSKKQISEEDLKEKLGTQKTYRDLIFINPEILKISKKKAMMEEGCLSVRWLYGKVSRAEKVLVKAYDENAKIFTIGATGLLAQAFQHEYDHLNGILFIDKATEVKEMPPKA